MSRSTGARPLAISAPCCARRRGGAKGVICWRHDRSVPDRDQCGRPWARSSRCGRARHEEQFLAWRKGLRARRRDASEGRGRYRTVAYAGRPVLLLMGNAAAWLPETLPRAATGWCGFPRRGAPDSLNLAVATGVMLFEVRRAALALGAIHEPDRNCFLRRLALLVAGSTSGSSGCRRRDGTARPYPAMPFLSLFTHRNTGIAFLPVRLRRPRDGGADAGGDGLLCASRCARETPDFRADRLRANPAARSAISSTG